jgi:putative nucleotidyltransferase with HDIG domain
VSIRTATMQQVGASSSGPVSSLVTQKVLTADILAEIDRLAPLPTVVMDVVRMVEDANSTIADLERLISQDLIIAARVCKLANSSFYARNAPAKTVGDAVKRLGFKTIKSLVIAAGAGKSLTKSMAHYAYNEFGLWKHSLGLALATRSLARNLGLPFHLQDELFLAGLMHDIGKLVLDPILGKAGIESGWLTTDREVATVGLDHTEVGCRVAKKWNLPEHAVAVITHHHSVDSAADFASHTAAIHLGDYLINDAKVGLSEQAEVQCYINPVALDILQIDASIVQEFHETVANELPDIVSMCDELTRC